MVARVSNVHNAAGTNGDASWIGKKCRRVLKALTVAAGEGRHKATWVNLSNGVVRRISDENVATCVHGERKRPIEPRAEAGPFAVSHFLVISSKISHQAAWCNLANGISVHDVHVPVGVNRHAREACEHRSACQPVLVAVYSRASHRDVCAQAGQVAGAEMGHVWEVERPVALRHPTVVQKLIVGNLVWCKLTTDNTRRFKHLWL